MDDLPGWIDNWYCISYWVLCFAKAIWDSAYSGGFCSEFVPDTAEVDRYYYCWHHGFYYRFVSGVDASEEGVEDSGVCKRRVNGSAYFGSAQHKPLTNRREKRKEKRKL